MAKSGERGSVDVLGLLPGPALKSNGGACDILHGEVFAYAVSGSVAIVDVRTPLQLVKTLQHNSYNSVSDRWLALLLCDRLLCSVSSGNPGLSMQQVRRMQLACVLQGPHRSSVVTAVSWWGLRAFCDFFNLPLGNRKPCPCPPS